MFSFLKKKKKKSGPPQLLDLNNNPLQEGDKVKSLRYELDECTIILEEEHYYYQSEKKPGEKISFTKMVDAITGNQKVVKIDS